ncbi:PP2C family protein-serine/threonine phosphatase [Streptomyces sp. NPDC051940]|uniref:PP2C family protein-serine/threonine phosphatase n=1 Tax=Streptomyces sp. NPDC051940 TaxID=3155675 RepID=UPI003446C22A
MLFTRLKRGAAPLEAIAPPGNVQTLLAVIAATVVVTVLGAVSGSVVWLFGLLVFLPATASALGTVRQTAFVSAWSAVVVTAGVIARPNGDRNWLDDTLMVLLTLILGTGSVYACQRRIDRENEMLRLRSTAAAMQRHILRPLPLLTDDVLVDGVYEPLQEERLVGGDIYDVISSPWGTRVLIGDVQGKGLAAVGAAFAVIGAFREAAHREATLTALVDALDQSVVQHNSYAEGTGEDERFVTALVISVDPGTEVQAVNCGHIPPDLLHEGTVTRPRLDTGVPLGLASLAGEPVVVSWFDFPAGATLLLSTDGLTETRASDGSFYPLEERLAARARLSPSELPRALCDDVRAFAGKAGQQDDLAVVTVRRTPHRAVPD